MSGDLLVKKITIAKIAKKWTGSGKPLVRKQIFPGSNSTALFGFGVFTAELTLKFFKFCGNMSLG